MDDLKNALKKALQPGVGLEARPQPVEAAPAGPADPDPYDSAWIRALARHVAIPKGAAVATLRQLTDQQVKALRGQGRDRDAKELGRMRDDWIRDAELRVWSQIKERFAALELSEKAYRSVKQNSKLQPEALLRKLMTRRAEEYRGASPERLREWLDTK